MSMKKIELNPGDILMVYGPKEATPPTPPPDAGGGFVKLLTIGSVTIFTDQDQSYVTFTSDLDICNDGSGPDYDDPHHQSQTAYYSGGRDGGQYLNADLDKYIVVPPQVRAMVPGVVMGSGPGDQSKKRR
jgi:hypothetical protein